MIYTIGCVQYVSMYPDDVIFFGQHAIPLSACRKETIMDELLSMYSNEQLCSELAKGHYWYFNGNFYSNAKKLLNKRNTSVENALYSRFYS